MFSLSNCSQYFKLFVIKVEKKYCVHNLLIILCSVLCCIWLQFVESPWHYSERPITNIRHWTESSLIQMMACCLLGARTSFEPTTNSPYGWWKGCHFAGSLHDQSFNFLPLVLCYIWPQYIWCLEFCYIVLNVRPTWSIVILFSMFDPFDLLGHTGKALECLYEHAVGTNCSVLFNE